MLSLRSLKHPRPVIKAPGSATTSLFRTRTARKSTPHACLVAILCEKQVMARAALQKDAHCEKMQSVCGTGLSHGIKRRFVLTQTTGQVYTSRLTTQLPFPIK